MIIRDNETVDLSTPSGVMRAHIFRPAAPGRFPGIIFFSEIYQVTGPIRRAAAILAGHGFMVMVPEVYHEYEAPGTVLTYSEAGTARGNQLKITKTVQGFDDDAKACVAYLQQAEFCTGNIGAVGMCLGGHLAFRAGLLPQVRAAACLYPTDIHKCSLGFGQADNSLARCAEITGELLMVFGRQDPHIPQVGRALIYERLSAAERTFEWHEYNAAHAFMRDEGPRYNPQLAAQCYALMVSLFQRTLLASV